MRIIVWPIIAIALFGWLTLISTLLIGSATIQWIIGKPIIIREGDEVTGYLKWFTFYPKLDK
jgi:hypothetical protein